MQNSAFHLGSLPETPIPEGLVFGRSAAMQEVRGMVERVADVSVPVLLEGEKGTGKELVAREIHHRSRWREGPFVRIASRELNVTDSRMQGRETEKMALRWRNPIRAEGAAGTLFFDEVSELNPAFQATLLGLFRGEHSGHEGAADGFDGGGSSRIICTTKRDLEKEVAVGNFRSDLFYRINIVTVHLPKLRDRREDIPELVEYFFEVQCRRQNRHCQPVPTDVLQLFCEYEWPGNIRELGNCIKKYVSTNGELTSVHRVRLAPAKSSLACSSTPASELIPLKMYRRQVVEQAEKDMIFRVLREQRWNRKEAARVLQISYNTLLQKLKQIGLEEKTESVASGSPREVLVGRRT
jgi:two-component system, NtrC family, response regulator AtoC